MEGSRAGDSARGIHYSLDTIDTFSLSFSVSISNHSLYSYGRRFANYRWQRPSVGGPESALADRVIKRIRNAAKESYSTKEVEDSSRERLSKRSRRQVNASLRDRCARDPLKQKKGIQSRGVVRKHGGQSR